MATLPITRLIIFKHGVGYFERRGAHSGERLELSFSREAMDDVLKSLVALDQGAGQVLGVDYETPEDRAARLARGSIHLSENRSLLDLLRDLRGRIVRLHLSEGKKGEAGIAGVVVGVDVEPEEPMRRAVVSLFVAEERSVRTVAVGDLTRVEILDDGAAADLAYFLRAAQSEEQRRSATLRLSPGDHELLVGYIAPAPAWRVSYRLLFEQEGAGPGSVLLQGWGLFDNQLDEDLSEVSLTLMAGMPVSFRYRLYEPHTPERPLVQDEERTVDAPLFFDEMPMAMPAAAPAPMAMGAAAMADAGGRRYAKAFTAESARLSAAALEESVQVAADSRADSAVNALA